jgi:hypothetical protein
MEPMLAVAGREPKTTQIVDAGHGSLRSRPRAGCHASPAQSPDCRPTLSSRSPSCRLIAAFTRRNCSANGSSWVVPVV